MKILLLGGTGAMGSHLANIVSNQENNVVITSRVHRESKDLIEYRQGNAKDFKFLTEVLSEKYDVIIDFMVYSEKEFSERVNLLLDFAHQYIFLSSSRVYNEIEKAITEESDRLLDSSLDEKFLSTNEYSLSKARQENILKSSEKRNWTIVRPYITYSEKRLQLGTLEKEDWLYRAIHGRTIIFSADIRDHLTTMTYGLDVAIGIASLINNPITFGEAYHITNEYAYKWNDILDIYLDVLEKKLGKRPKVIYQNLYDFQVWNPGKYQILYDRLFDRKFDNTKVNTFINTNEFLKVHVGLKKCMNEFLLDPQFSNINWKNEAIKDKFTKERTSLKEISRFKHKIKYLVFRYFIKIKQYKI